MRPGLKVFLFLASACAAFAFTLHKMPGLIMSRAMVKMEASGIALHDFTLAPRMTPQTQTVVRPSPDLAYSICLFEFGADLTELDIRIAAYDGMSSVSFFDAKTNNFAVHRVPEGEPIMLKLSAPGTIVAGEAAQQDSAGMPANTIISPSQRGLILIRRLAPTEAEYESVSRLSEGDMCAPVTVLAGSLRAQEE